MKLLFSPRFLKQYRDAPMQVQKAFDKQARLLIDNLRHPGLHSKKFDEARDIWQARVNTGLAFLLYDRGRHLPPSYHHQAPEMT
jgi:hypothetical protein